MAGFPSLEPFPSARSPNEEGVSGLWSIMLIPLFVLLLLLGREEDKKRPSVLLVSQPVASKDCPLSAGCWSSLLRGPRKTIDYLPKKIESPTYEKRSQIELNQVTLQRHNDSRVGISPPSEPDVRVSPHPALCRGISTHCFP